MTSSTINKMAKELWWLDYQQALRSTHWHDLKAQVKIRCNGICEWPGCKEPCQELHHCTYHHLGNETADECRYVCTFHHEIIHDQRSLNRRR